MLPVDIAAEVDFVRHGLAQFDAQPRFHCLIVDARGNDGRADRASTRFGIGYGDPGVSALLIAIQRAATDIKHGIIGYIVFDAGKAENVLQLGTGERRTIIEIRLGHFGNCAVADHYLRAKMVHLITLIGAIQRDPQIIGSPVERCAANDGAAKLVVHCDIAAAVGTVDPHTELVIFAKPAGNVCAAAEMAVGQIACRDARQRAVTCTLKLQAHIAADPGSARRRAIQKCVRPVQHLNTRIQLGRDQLARADAVKTVHPDIVAVKRETADHELFRCISERIGSPDRRIVFQNLAQRQRLLVQDQAFIECAHHERYVQSILGAQNSQRSARDDFRLIGPLGGNDDHFL